MSGNKGTIHVVKDESGKVVHAFGTLSGPLPKNHWLYEETGNPPMPLRMGIKNPEREVWKERLRLAGRYAVKAATMSGQEDDFDPDALIQNLIVGMLGYHSEDGLSSEDMFNPKPSEAK